ncbi:MAG TPA: hypothetical protein ENI38_02095 [Candidatus Acetothermia bacterium]|nr:hypothetical protein [Candidatus Acetothermia bacterium]
MGAGGGDPRGSNLWDIFAVWDTDPPCFHAEDLDGDPLEFFHTVPEYRQIEHLATFGPSYQDGASHYDVTVLYRPPPPGELLSRLEEHGYTLKEVFQIVARDPQGAVDYSTVTVLARLRGWSTSVPRKRAM